MPVGDHAKTELLPVDGARLVAVQSSLKYQNRLDLSILELCEGTTIAGVFTQNAFCAAPVQLAKLHLQKRNAEQKSYFLTNTAYANAGTGDRGYQDAVDSCQYLATKAGVLLEQVFPFSTGVIGERFAVDKICAGIDKSLEQGLEASNWSDYSEAILTTDTRSKAKSLQVEIDGQLVTITGVSKGSGMIKPNMATMLAYVVSDADIEQSLLQDMLAKACDVSFNCISVDGDTSTNDCLMLAATGKSSCSLNSDSSLESLEKFQQALNELCIFLAQEIVKDGEGATKFITLDVQQGLDLDECKQLAYTVAHSPLVKTAFFASDPNWGRILAALGRAGLKGLDINKVDIYLDDVCLVQAGRVADSYREEDGQKVMAQENITVRFMLARGDAQAIVWTCDFSYDYVKINAEYRS